MECLRLRVKDIDFEQSQVVVSEGKGEKDRLTMLPASLVEPLKAQIAFDKQQHERDLANGYGSVELPMLWRANIPTLTRNYPGYMCFRPIAYPPTHTAESPAVTI
jgi:integrase